MRDNTTTLLSSKVGFLETVGREERLACLEMISGFNTQRKAQSLRKTKGGSATQVPLIKAHR